MYILRQEVQTGQINEWMNKGIDEWIVKTYKCTYCDKKFKQVKWMNEKMNEWMNEWINEWMNELMNE